MASRTKASDFKKNAYNSWTKSTRREKPRCKSACIGSFPLTVTVTTMGNRSYNSPLNKAPLRTVTGRGNDPTHASGEVVVL